MAEDVVQPVAVGNHSVSDAERADILSGLLRGMARRSGRLRHALKRLPIAGVERHFDIGIYVRTSDAASAHQEQLTDAIIVDRDVDGQVVGVEFLGAIVKDVEINGEPVMTRNDRAS